ETTFSDYYPNTGVILYGEGVKTIILPNNTPEDQLLPIDTYLVGTASGSINIESLPKQDNNSNNLIYYVFKDDAFVKATSGTVEANSCYLVLTEGVQYPLPDMIKIQVEEDPDAIINVMPDKNINFIGIYTINGQKVGVPIKGLNIINGKRFL
ncbi:MAG: hypothetical protein K6E54_03930, partial [Bacteroidaceae bacterium]|nr:hypothetical protein [Bacteroidaceae bacterium]